MEEEREIEREGLCECRIPHISVRCALLEDRWPKKGEEKMIRGLIDGKSSDSEHKYAINIHTCQCDFLLKQFKDGLYKGCAPYSPLVWAVAPS